MEKIELPCYMCKQRRPIERFYKDRSKSTGFSNRCKDCDNRKTGMAAKSDAVAAAKAGPCRDCGIKYPAYVMEFDHTGQEPKDFNVAQGVLPANLPERVLLAEIAKCDVVCANCHKIRTHARRTADQERKAAANREAYAARVRAKIAKLETLLNADE